VYVPRCPEGFAESAPGILGAQGIGILGQLGELRHRQRAIVVGDSGERPAMIDGDGESGLGIVRNVVRRQVLQHRVAVMVALQDVRQERQVQLLAYIVMGGSADQPAGVLAHLPDGGRGDELGGDGHVRLPLPVVGIEYQDHLAFAYVLQRSLDQLVAHDGHSNTEVIVYFLRYYNSNGNRTWPGTGHYKISITLSVNDGRATGRHQGHEIVGPIRPTGPAQRVPGPIGVVQGEGDARPERCQ